MSKILIVDDEPDIRAVLTYSLARTGHEILSAGSAEEALEVAAAHPDQIKLLITDIVMPGIGGRELVWRMLQMNPRLDVILCSGYVDEENAMEMLDIPEITFFPKPVDLNQLVATVSDLLAAPK